MCKEILVTKKLPGAPPVHRSRTIYDTSLGKGELEKIAQEKKRNQELIQQALDQVASGIPLDPGVFKNIFLFSKRFN